MVSVGDKVLYSPDHCHALNLDARGALLFTFVHAEDTRGSSPSGKHPGYPSRAKGEAADMQLACSDHERNLHLPQRDAQGRIVTHQGHVVAPGKPVEYWPAVVVGLNADGTADLDVQHPCGYITLHYPDRSNHPAAPGIRYDAANKGPHTFHLPGE